MNWGIRILAVAWCALWVDPFARAEPTSASLFEYCDKNNVFNQAVEKSTTPEQRRDMENLRAFSLQRCLKDEEAARSKVETLLGDGAVKEAARTCLGHAAYSRMLQCVEHYKRLKDEDTKRWDFVSAQNATNEPMPKADAKRACRMRAEQYKDYDYAGCMAKQQAAYDFLKERWPHLPPQIAIQCKWMITERVTDYSIVRTCIEMEIDKAMHRASIPAIPFKY